MDEVQIEIDSIDDGANKAGTSRELGNPGAHAKVKKIRTHPVAGVNTDRENEVKIRQTVVRHYRKYMRTRCGNPHNTAVSHDLQSEITGKYSRTPSNHRPIMKQGSEKKKSDAEDTEHESSENPSKIQEGEEKEENKKTVPQDDEECKEYDEEEYSMIEPFEKMSDEQILLMASQNNDLDDLALGFCEDLIKIAKTQGENARTKSLRFKVLDISFYLLIIIISGVVGILGIKGGNVSNDGDNEQSESQLFIVGVMGFIIGILMDVSRRFDFGNRSVKVRECFHRFRMIRRRLNNLKVSGNVGPMEKLNILTKYQALLDEVDLESFDLRNLREGEPGGGGDQENNFGLPKVEIEETNLFA